MRNIEFAHCVILGDFIYVYAWTGASQDIDFPENFNFKKSKINCVILGEGAFSLPRPP